MRHALQTEIDIQAPIEQVWARLSDLAAYPSWNPFIKSIRGQLALGSELQIQLHPPDASPLDP